ncbi:glycosyltransferase family 2 protein [Pseudoalteromonas sp. EB27]|uniref:glycosyltransferase n=1 Tax=Pseudoalteromonas sp. EB27 TaxID=1938368 RepID=UPI000978885E|nr:glycosyltransferase family 2 protein [Pseudoalteromonas sp. EB27]
MNKIIVSTLTTGSRNETFNHCLASLQELANISDYQIDILVVENNKVADKSVLGIIENYSNGKKHVKHLLEPLQGIPHARNAALNFAKKEGYTYLAFIDDDAFASKCWIENLVKTIETNNVASGPQLAIFPESTGTFYRNAAVYHERTIADGDGVKWAATNNILIDISFMEANDLSFNPELINGGEDKELFLRVNKSGGNLIWSKEAVVSEYVAQSRLSVKWAMRRTFRIGATGFMIESSVKTPFMTYLSCIFKGWVYLTKGVLLLPYHAISPKSSTLNSLCDLSHGVGFFYGLFSRGRVSKYT